MSSINLERTCDATANSGYSNKWTFSAWVKRGLLGTEQGLFANKRTDNNTNSRFRLRIKSTERLCWEIKDSSGSDDNSFETNMLFRDPNAWYHIVFIYDSDNSTETDRMKCYVNGKDVRTELGGFSSVNEVGSGFGSLWSSSVKNYLGVTHDNSGNPYRWDGIMSHVHFTYGYRYEASTFGSTDTTTGEWKINASPSVTYGSQGFHLFKDNASVTDQSGQGNNYTLNAGTLTKTEDCPSNVFATWNPLNNYYSQSTFANGNTKVTMGSTEYAYNTSTLGMTSGKYYAEFKQGSGGSDSLYGISSTQATSTSAELGNYPNDYGYYQSNGSVLTNNGSVGGWSANTWSSGDIIGVAVDLDNNKLYFSKNGSWQNSGDPTSGSTGTGAISITDVASTNLGAYFFGFSDYWGAGTSSCEANFGNGYFGTTAVSSAGTNASGIGIFEYDVPAGYTALSTKGLNE